MTLGIIKILVWKGICKLVGSTQRLALLVRLRGRFLSDPTGILLSMETNLPKRARDKLVPDAWNGGWPIKTSIAVMIPFRDQWQMTAKCLAALARQDTGCPGDAGAPGETGASPGLQVHVVLIDNGSMEDATIMGLADARRLLPKSWGVQTIRIEAPFNFSRLNNQAVAGLPEGVEFLLFLNNDVELTDPSSLSRMAQFAAAQVRGGFPLGALGCTLLYPDGRLQHLFAAPGVKIAAAHPLRGTQWRQDFLWNKGAQPVPAVTAAAMLVPRVRFNKIGGFDEGLPTAAQDIDLCLKLQKAGYTNVTLPEVVAIHHESRSRQGRAIQKGEIARFYARWGEFAHQNPWYPPGLSRWNEQPALRMGLGAEYPWEKVL
jgi:hypothetical protein